MLDKEVFKNPSAKYRPIPFWFWNSKLRPDDIEAQIRDFHAKGLGGFFIHARFGLETDYLSRDWMDCVRLAVSIAEELGLEVWLYDENGFPSGIGNLKVSRVREYRPKYIGLTECEVSSRETTTVDVPRGDVLLAYASKKSKSDVAIIDLSDCIHGNQLVWTPPRGDWNIAIYSKRALDDPNDVIYGVNYLNPEAMRFFFDYTFDPYVKAVGEHFGKTIKGMFTDEPTLLSWHHDGYWYQQREHARVIVWDDQIESEMQTRIQMSARDFLPHMFFEVDETTPEIRRAFWDCVEKLYLKAFWEPYRDWCDEHNLKFTGHALFEEGLFVNTEFQADITASLETMHIPGVDHLADTTEEPYGVGNSQLQLTNVQGIKLITSLGHCTGKEAILSETYGRSGWSLNPQKMKWIADWQYSLGINMLVPHAMSYSIEGFRKTDAPPSENHEPWWNYYKKFADYIGRLSYVMREGRHVAKIALFYPLKDFWGKHAAGRENEKDRIISDSFDLCASILPRLHYDFDILTEQELLSAEISEGKFTIGNESYEVLIAPISITEGAAAEKVREYVQSGGTWILPPMTHNDPDQGHLQELADTLAGNGTVIPVLAGTIDRYTLTQAMRNALQQAITPDVKLTSPSGKLLTDVRYIHREIDGKHAYFVANTSDQPAKCVISLETMGSVEKWDLETGDTAPVASIERREDRLCTQHELPPYGSALFVVDPQEELEFLPAREVIRAELLTLPDEWKFETEGPNALILKDMNFEISTSDSGTKYTYCTDFRCEYTPETLLLMLDDIEYRSSLMGSMHIDIKVNDTTWVNPDFEWHLDKGFKTLDISKAIRSGNNRIEIVIAHSPWSGQPLILNSAPVLLGDFACQVESRTIMAPAEAAQSGSWTEFGYPCFSGTATYTLGFRLPREAKGKRVIVSLDSVQDMVEIWVNSRRADLRLWQPWEADITDLVTSSRNMLSLKITNTMSNFIEARPRPSGLMGRVRILSESIL